MPSFEDIYAFTHAIVQQAAYQLLPPSARSDLHGGAIKLLGALPEPPAADLALHARLAQHGAEPADAEKYLQTERHWVAVAADYAESAFRTLDTVRYLERLIELLPPDAPKRILSQCRLVDMLLGIDRAAEALSHAESARQAAMDAGDTKLVAASERALGAAKRDGERNAEAPAHFELAARLFRKLGHDLELAKALLGLSGCRWIRGELTQAATHIEDAWQAATRAADARVSAKVAMNRLGIAIQDGRYQEAEQFLADVERLVGESRDPAERMRMHSFRGYAFDTMQRLSEARLEYEIAMDLAQQLGSLVEVARCQTNLASLDALDKRFGKARERHVAAERLAREMGDLRVAAYALIGQGTIDSELGDYQSALERHYAGLRLAERLQLGVASAWRVSVGTLHAELGDIESARQVLLAATPERDSMDEKLRLAVLAVIAQRLGEPEAAQEYARRSAQTFGDRGEPVNSLARQWISMCQDLMAS